MYIFEAYFDNGAKVDLGTLTILIDPSEEREKTASNDKNFAYIEQRTKETAFGKTSHNGEQVD